MRWIPIICTRCITFRIITTIALFTRHRIASVTMTLENEKKTSKSFNLNFCWGSTSSSWIDLFNEVNSVKCHFWYHLHDNGTSCMAIESLRIPGNVQKCILHIVHRSFDCGNADKVHHELDHGWVFRVIHFDSYFSPLHSSLCRRIIRCARDNSQCKQHIHHCYEHRPRTAGRTFHIDFQPCCFYIRDKRRAGRVPENELNFFIIIFK